jgi:hypothetical protein
MKLSVEAKVAAAVAMAFATLTLAVVAQEGSEHGIARLNQSTSQGPEMLSVQNPNSAIPLIAQY